MNVKCFFIILSPFFHDLLQGKYIIYMLNVFLYQTLYFFSMICFKINMLPIHDLPFLKPVCSSSNIILVKFKLHFVHKMV